jgi:ketosteroid isomerase-like protein
MSLSNLAGPPKAFLKALRAGDVIGIAAALDDEAVLTAEGREYRGEQLLAWLRREVSLWSGAAVPIDETKRNGEVVLTIVTRERGEDGSARDVQRDWRLVVRASRVASVKIEPSEVLNLPAPIEAYVRATNASDLEGLVASFHERALVNDQLRDHWGKQAIRDWAAREVIGECLTMRVVKVVEHHGHVVVSANINGNLDTRGLPDPLVLSFYFSAPDDKIVLLIILRNESGD